ncbi:MAG: sugar phosphate isomerase/epimerase [candidate division WOR-3 bacterium]|nr:MAG: sugar phosphate isomerase/epimerase [candidate division WOR-3 bacterium]
MISIGTTFNYEIVLNDQLRMVKESGFSHVSLGARVVHSNYLTTRGQKDIRALVQGHGLAICSIHTPFGEGLDISSPHRGTGDDTVDVYRKCIEAAHCLSARVVIFHPTAYQRHDNIEIRKKTIVRNLGKLLDYLGKTGVTIAVENDSHDAANDIVSFSLDEIGDVRYGFCYDSSHDNLVQQPLALLKKYGSRLFTTHISDNRGNKDDHMLPYQGTYDWNGFCEIFTRLGFVGVFLLEVEMRESGLKSPAIFLREAFARGERLRKICQKE